MNPVSSLLFTSNLANEGPPIALLSKATCWTCSDLITVQLICYRSMPDLHIAHLPSLSTVPKMRGIEVINDPLCQAVLSSLPIADIGSHGATTGSNGSIETPGAVATQLTHIST